jgi:IclR family transcriptional regulator, pca regulon regulatory protein
MFDHRPLLCDDRTIQGFNTALQCTQQLSKLSMNSMLLVTKTHTPTNVHLPAPTNDAQPSLHRRDWIAGLEKGLGILEAFGEAHARVTAAQMAGIVGLTRTATRRYLLTLTHLGYVATDGKLFWLTPRVLRMGQAFIESSRLARTVQPFLQRVTAGTQEIAYVSMLEGNDIVYVARNGPTRVMNTGFVLGARVPAQVTAAGMLLLATRTTPHYNDWLSAQILPTYTQHTITDKANLSVQLAQIRQQEWALSEQQLDLHYRGVAVPLRDARGTLIAALSVIMPMQDEAADVAVARVLGVLRETAAAMRNLI